MNRKTTAAVFFHTKEKHPQMKKRPIPSMALSAVLCVELLRQESWQAKHAALAAVKQTVEYVEEQRKETRVTGHVIFAAPWVGRDILKGRFDFVSV